MQIAYSFIIFYNNVNTVQNNYIYNYIYMNVCVCVNHNYIIM